jgi:hypothetical protein
MAHVPIVARPPVADPERHRAIADGQPVVEHEEARVVRPQPPRRRRETFCVPSTCAATNRIWAAVMVSGSWSFQTWIAPPVFGMGRRARAGAGTLSAASAPSRPTAG